MGKLWKYFSSKQMKFDKLSSCSIIKEVYTAKNQHEWTQSRFCHNSRKIQNLKKQIAVWFNLQALNFVKI